MNEFEEFCYNHNIVIRYNQQLTSKVRGFCYYDGYEYNVFINQRLALQQQRKSTIHELIHIFNNHFNCDPTYSSQCEQEVKQIIKTMNQFYDVLK